MSSHGIFPDISLGGIVITELPTAGVTNAYIPPEGYTLSSDLTYYGVNCNFSRYDPQQINAFEAEMLALAARMNPTGTWNTGDVTNLANAFTNWSSTLELGDGVTFSSALAIREGASESTVIRPDNFKSAVNFDGLEYQFTVNLIDNLVAGSAAMLGIVSSTANVDGVKGQISGSGSGSAVSGYIVGSGSGYAGYFSNFITGNGVHVVGNILASGTITPSDTSLKIDQKAIDDKAAIEWSKKLAWVDFIKFNDPQAVEKHNEQLREHHIQQSNKRKSDHADRKNIRENHEMKIKHAISSMQDINRKLTSAIKQSETDKSETLSRRISVLKNSANQAQHEVVRMNADLSVMKKHETSLAHSILVDASTILPEISATIDKKNEAASLGTQAGLIAQQVLELVTATGYGGYVIKTMPSGKLALDYMSIFAIVNRGLQLRIERLEQCIVTNN